MRAALGRSKWLLILARRLLLRRAWPLTGTTFVTMLSHNFDLVLLGLSVGSAAAGLYGAAYRVVWVPTILVTAYHAALRPTLAGAYQNGLASVAALLRRSNRLTAAAAVGLVVGGVMLAAPLVSLLYGGGYAGAVLPFQICSPPSVCWW